MKIEQVIVQQLYSKKEISLQGIGIFKLNNSVSLPVDSEKGMVIPENAISFDYNPKATEDADLIDSIVLNTKKIKPLASADLDSFLMLGRQFLNIGKPFILEGLGTLDKAQTGELIFIPGQFVTPKIEPPKALKENENEEKSGLFPDYDSETNNNGGKKALLIIIAVLILGGGAWAAYYFLYKKNNTDDETTNKSIENVSDSSAVNKDTSNAQPGSLQHEVVNDGYTFKIVFKETRDKQDAIKTLNKYKEYGHKVIMYSIDSIHYKVAEPFTRPLSDTTQVKDSLNKYFYLGKAHVEVK